MTTYETLDKEKVRSKIESSIKKYKDKNSFQPLKRDYKKTRIISFDVETTGKNNEFYLCGIIDYNDEFHVFFDVEDAINYFKRIRHNDVMIFATNLAFDYTTIFKDHEYFNRCEFIVNKGQFICITMNATYHKIKMGDSLNYGGFSVEVMGDKLKIPKLKKPRCLGREPRSAEELRELVIYNKRDCEVTKKFMEYLQLTLNEMGGELKLTISSCAMDIFSRVFLQEVIYKESLTLNFEVKDKIYSAYYGGRTEAFARGTLKPIIINNKKYYFKYYDVNSLYPSVMLNKFPNPNSVKYKYYSNTSYLNFEGVSYFELDIPYSDYPLLPFRENNKLIFPYGKIKGYYTHVEIRKAISIYGEGIIHKMLDTVYYTECKHYFKNYINYMYEKRLEKKRNGDFMELFYKLLMNSLYGRFAMREINKTNFFKATSNEVIMEKIKEAGRNAKFNIKNGDISYYYTTKNYDGNNSLPIWSVYTTAYARILMYELLSKNKAVYTDTDSLITLNEIEESKLLGALKLEESITHGVIVKPKLYVLNDTLFKAKGVRMPKASTPEETQRLRLEMFNSILNKESVYYMKFVKLKESIIQSTKLVNEIIEVEKNIDLEDNKRDWNDKLFNTNELQFSKPIKIKAW